MKIIISQDKLSLGRAGEAKTVADGFARNYLFPRRLAVPYSEGALKAFGKRRAKKETELKHTEKEALEMKSKLESLKLEFSVLVDAKGELYGSVSKGQILKGLKARGFSLPRAASLELRSPLKSVGEFKVPLELQSHVTAMLQVALMRSEPAAPKQPA